MIIAMLRSSSLILYNYFACRRHGRTVEYAVKIYSAFLFKMDCTNVPENLDPLFFINHTTNALSCPLVDVAKKLVTLCGRK